MPEDPQLRVPVLTGPLLPLLPPKPLNRQLPPLPTRRSATPIAAGWTWESLVIPAAYPRMFPHSTRTANEPSADPTRKSETKAALAKGFERLLETVVDSYTHPVQLDDQDELERQQQLVIVGNRYRPPASKKTASRNAGPGLTLVLSHANGFYKEVWEPMLADLLDELERRQALPIDEIWSLDCALQGDAAVLNEQVIGSTYNWAENGRDLLNFVAYHLDSQDDQIPQRRAAGVPLETGLLDNVTTIGFGPANPLQRTYRQRLIVGIGHSLGGSATAFAATACPAFFSSLILIDPVLAPPHTSSPERTAAVAMGALRRRGEWKTREEARRQFEAKPFFQSWDSRVLDGYVQHGLTETQEGSVELKARPFYEAVTFMDALSSASRRATTRLSSLTRKLPLHYIFADEGRSMLPEPATTYLVSTATPHASWTRVRGAGHLVPLEKPRETAVCVADFLEKTYPAERVKPAEAKL